MKKLFCLLVLVLCSCRSVPSEYYVIGLDKSEMVNLSYEFQEREEKGNWSGKWGSSVAEKMNAVRILAMHHNMLQLVRVILKKKD